MKPILEAIQNRWAEYQAEAERQSWVKLPDGTVLRCLEMESRLAEFWQNFDHQFPKPE